MKKLPKNIAVLCGGFSAEREVSLVSGNAVLQGLRGWGSKAVAFDLLPPLKRKSIAALKKKWKSPAWANSAPLDALGTFLSSFEIDFVFLALHGPGGEDGKIQGFLDMLGIAYSGSRQLASTLAMNKQVAKGVFRREGLLSPDWAFAEQGFLPKVKGPVVVKPVDQGSAIGVSVVRHSKALLPALRKAWIYGDALVESYVQGREFTVGVLGNRALPVIEILPQKADFYDYRSKYADGGSKHLCPAPLPSAKAKQAQVIALAAHQVLGCKAYSRADMMMDKKGKFWLLEVNTLPGMTPVSLFPEAAKAAGIGFGKLLEEMILLS